MQETVKIPTHLDMMWPTLQALVQLGGSGANHEITQRAIEYAGYSEAQQEVPHKDGPQTQVQYRMAWARSYLKAVGALENST